jgi:drug/metabolite transporter (DMT)-like permease
MVHVALVACMASWGLVFVGIHVLLESIDAVQIVTFRFVLISVVVLVALAVSPGLRPKFSRREWMIVVASGALAVPLSQLAIVYAQEYLSPPLASLVVSSSPAFAAIMAAAILGERVRLRQVCGLVLALLGVAVVVAVGSSGARFEVTAVLPASVAVVTPIAWALYTVISKPLAAHHAAAGTVGVTLVIGTVFLAPFAPHAIEGLDQLDTAGWMWLVCIAVAGTAPYLVWFKALRTLPASQTAAYMYLIPAFALLWTLVLLHEAPKIGALFGGVLVVAGVALAQLGSSQPRPAAPVRVKEETHA